MARISEDTIQQIAAANDIVDVVGSYLQLKRAGSSWRAICPFHAERTPSFHVNPARQGFHCFGCGASGSVFRFVMDYENLDFPEAARRLAQRAGIPLQEESPEDQFKRGERDRLTALHRDAAAWFHANLMKRAWAAPARDYLKNRGINGEIAARWQLGFAPDSWDSLVTWATESGYSIPELRKSGLVSVNDERESVYDRFRNRVMFPICSDYGSVIAFSGRTLGDDPAKYVNSPETPLFTKGRVLFGLDRTKRAIMDADEAIVCEGQIDLISAFEAGVENVIAPQGTAFTRDQARLLRRFAASAVLCFDSDTAGQNAVERSLPALLSCGVSVRVARLPGGQDPDSLIRSRGADAFRDEISRAGEFFADTLQRECRLDMTPQARSALAGRLAPYLKVIADPALRDAQATLVRTRLGLSQDAFDKVLRFARAPDAGPESQGSEAPAPDVLELPERARILCRFALANADVRAWFCSLPESPSEFGEEFELLEKIARANADPSDPARFAGFLAQLSPTEERFVGGLSLDHLPEKILEAAQDAWFGTRKGAIREKIISLQAQMADPNVSIAALSEINKQILDLQSHLNDSL